MKATVTITKSFDDGNEFSKTWEDGDFEQFFCDEGMYLDRLSKITEIKGQDGEGFTITYTVKIQK